MVSSAMKIQLVILIIVLKSDLTDQLNIEKIFFCSTEEFLFFEEKKNLQIHFECFLSVE